MTIQTRETIEQLLRDEVLPNHLPDVAWLLTYLDNDCPHGDPIILSLGETWSQAPAQLTHLLSRSSQFVHGYQLSMYGLPAFRRVLRDYMIRSQHLPLHTPFEVAATWSGTRSMMFDYGRLLRAQQTDRRTPVVLVSAPGWDYAGVFEPLGFKMCYLKLRPEAGFYPSVDEYVGLVESIEQDPGQYLALVVINAQHNPTGVNWDQQLVQQLIRTAIHAGAAILLDDAYYAVHSPRIQPTSALKMLLQELADVADSQAQQRWLAVRSLGKQFHCNGWALGAVASHPATLDRLVNEFRVQHQYNYLGVLQQAMARWLSDPASDAFLHTVRESYEQKRALLDVLFQTRLNYPRQAYHLGECTSYLLFAIPEVYTRQPDGVRQYLHDCFIHTGVLFSDPWLLPRVGDTLGGVNYVRMYLGPDLEVLEAAVERMARAGLTYDMPGALT